MTGDSGGIAALAIRRPIGTLAIASVVFVLGLFILQRLPVDLLPSIEYPQIRVMVNYPGVAPEVMEDQVTRVLERNLAATENLVHIESRAQQGRTSIDLHFAYGTDLDLALQDASRYLELARTQLPAGIQPPRLNKFDPSQSPVWEAGFSSSRRSEAEVRDWVENRLSPQLIAVPGVAGVEVAGGQQRELEVVVDPARLRAYGLSMSEVAVALAAENVDVAAGWVTSASFDVMARTDGRFTSVAEIENVLLALPGSARRLRLGDIAQVRDGHREQRLFVRLNGTPAAQVSVFKLPAANTVEVADAVQATLQRLIRSGFIPADIEYRATRDPAFFIRGAIGSVGAAALVGGALAMVMVLLFLGSLRKSFAIGLSIPLALMATFALMGAGGLTLNIISLGGLALGVGLLLDNAIVMLENIYRHRDQLGKDSEQAARDGAAEVVSAVTAGTLTNLAAVLPFLLISGLAALIFRELILTISFAILATLAAALTVVPMLAATLGKLRFSSGLERSLPLRLFNRGLVAVRAGYRWLLGHVLRWRWLALGVVALSLAGTLQLAGELGNEFLPAVDDGGIVVRMALPSGTSPEETDAAARRVEATLRELPEVESVFALVGGHLSGGVVNERPGIAWIRVQLTPLVQRPQLPAAEWVSQAQRALHALELPGARISVRPPSIPGLRFGRRGDDLAVSVVGEDLATLSALARKINARLQDLPGLEGVEVGRDEQSPLLRIRVDRERAATYGLRVSEVAESIHRAVDGYPASRYLAGSQEYDIRVRLPQAMVSDTERLGELPLLRQGGAPVLLRHLASFELGEGPARIERENQSRVVNVVADINPAVADVGTIMQGVEARLADFELPDQYSLLIGGQWETIQETQRELAMVIGLAVFLVFVVLAVQYERLSNPLVILAAAPLSLIGVVLILWLTATPLSAPVMIGSVLLVGIVVNNAILLVEYIELGRAERELDVEEAILEAGAVRLRPILMTTSTTVLGMLPLAFSLGEGAEIMQPLALTVIGGLLGSMLLTLFVVPCLYLIVSGLSERLHRLFVSSSA